jgi:mono/diheme cytochrome c family protein
MFLMKNTRTVFTTASVALPVLLLALAGCTKSDHSASPPEVTGDSALAATGKTIFQSNGCTRCHALNGQGGRMGPDLTHAGADPKHTPQWIAEFVKDPKAVNPGSRMPAFGNRINDQDRLALGTYLASLK